MEPLSIAALVAMLAGAAVQYQAQVEAQDAQQAAIRNSLDAQERLQREAEQKAMKTAETFNPLDRMKQQAELETQITDSLITPVASSQSTRADAAGAEGNVSEDYTLAKAKADTNTLKSAEALARLLGKTSSANRLRLEEGVRLMDTGQQLGMLNNFSQGQKGADSIAIQQAGMVDPGMVLAGSLLQAAGSAGLMYGGGSAANAAKTGTTTAAGATGASSGLASNGMNAAADFKSYAPSSGSSSWLSALKAKPF